MGELVYFNDAELIESIVRNAYQKSCCDDWSCFNDIKCLDNPKTFYIYLAVFESLATNLKSGCRETTVYEWFRNNYKEVLNNEYKIVKKKSNRHHIPDFWVMDESGKEIPVECKYDVFNTSALQQLKRYMEFYKTEKGIAVAQRCIVDLPPNITFLNWSKELKF